MKTGTITFHAPNNNGSFLQAYALQTVLKNQLGGVENEIIDFYSEKQMRQYAGSQPSMYGWNAECLQYFVCGGVPCSTGHGLLYGVRPVYSPYINRL